jgi:DNA-binding XRE family transcriptional regulator
VNKFAEWIKNNDKKQRGVAQKLGIGTTTLHEIIRNGQLPSLKLAYAIEDYTRGAVTLYDWIDEEKKEQMKPQEKIKNNKNPINPNI